MLNSERYAHLSDQARLFFVHLMLIADDYGCVSLSPTYLRRQCFYDSPSNERIARLICELADADMIRTYEIYPQALGFIPRFGQRLQRFKSKYPPPPPVLYHDDAEAKNKFNDLTKKPTVIHGDSPPEVEEKKKLKLKRREENTIAPSDPNGSSALVAVVKIPLNDKSEYPITQAMIDEWTKLYSDCDVPQTLNEIRGWNLANPTKRKTKSGVLNHINRWLAKVHNG